MGLFEAIWFLAALEESYRVLCAPEYDLENGAVMCACSRCLVLSAPTDEGSRQLDCSIRLIRE